MWIQLIIFGLTLPGVLCYYPLGSFFGDGLYGGSHYGGEYVLGGTFGGIFGEHRHYSGGYGYGSPQINRVHAVLHAQTLASTIENKYLSAFGSPKKMGKINDEDLTAVSGLASSRKYPHILYAVNGGSARTGRKLLYALDAKTADVVARYKLQDVENCDWQDIAVGYGPHGRSYVYIGDIGGNQDRICNTIYRFPEPDRFPHNVQDEFLISDGEIKFDWQEKDGGSLMVDRRGDVYVISTARPGSVARLYRIAFEDFTRNRIIRLTAGVELNIRSIGNYPTAGDVRFDDGALLVKSEEKVFYWKIKEGESLAQVVQRQPLQNHYIQERKGSAMGFDFWTGGYYTLSEGKHATLFYYPPKEDNYLAGGNGRKGSYSSRKRINRILYTHHGLGINPLITSNSGGPFDYWK